MTIREIFTDQVKDVVEYKNTTRVSSVSKIRQFQLKVLFTTNCLKSLIFKLWS